MNIQTQETALRKQRGLLTIIKKCFNFPTIHTVSWSSVSPMFLWVQPLILKLEVHVWSSHWNSWSNSKWCQHYFFSFHICLFWGGYRKHEKKWLMFYWVCLPFRFVWLHLMFPVAFLFVLIPPLPSLQIWLPVSPSDFQRLQSMKHRLWTWARFSFSDLPFSLPSISVRLSVFVAFLFPDSQSGRQACDRQLWNHGTTESINTSSRVFTALYQWYSVLTEKLPSQQWIQLG